jgi:hypothetical protein
MASIYPKLTWPSNTEANSFVFKYPPLGLSNPIVEATRHDNDSSYGIRETIQERTVTYLNMDVPNVATGTDLTNWQTFLAYAIGGGQFYYYPDNTSGTKTLYTLDDQKYEIKKKANAVGMFEFSGRFRQVIT